MKSGHSASNTYAVGAAAAGIAAIGIGMVVIVIHIGSVDSVIISAALVFVLAAAIGGWVGGRLCWRLMMGDPPLPVPRALAIAAATSVSSLLIGAVAAALAFASIDLVSSLIERNWRGALGNFFEVLMPALLLGPVYGIPLFGIQFAVLVLIWTFWRRGIVNRASLTSPPD